jgi:hypothetical protein
MLLRKRYYSDLNRQFAQLLASAETLAQKRENFFGIDSAVRGPDKLGTDCRPI